MRVAIPRAVFGGLLLALACGAAPALAKAPLVAVFPFDARGVPLRAAALATLEEVMTTRVAVHGLPVVPRDRMLALLKARQGADRFCRNAVCQLDVARTLHAHHAVVSKLRRLGRRCVLMLTLLDVASATTKRAAESSGPCDEESVLATVRGALAKLCVRPKPAVVTPRAKLLPADVRTGMDAIMDAVRACYDRYQKPGIVRVRVRIATNGRVARADALGALGKSPTGTCVQHAVRAARFPPFVGKPMTFVYPFRLVPPTTLSRHELLAAMERIRPLLHECGMAHKHTGKAKVALSIDGSGRITRLTIQGSLANTPVGGCVRGAVLTARFRAHGGPAVNVVFPVVLR